MTASEPRPRLWDLRMADGSRHFGDLPEHYDVNDPEWNRLRDAVPQLDGATLTGFTTDDVTEAWIEFRFAGHDFSINNQSNDWWFFVQDPSCPDELLLRVLDHFEARLQPIAALARSRGPLPGAWFRVLVHEARGRISHHDFATREQATHYADDAASETEDGPVASRVFDGDFRRVYEGRHYGTER